MSDENKKPPFKITLIFASIAIPLMIAAFILNKALWIAAGWTLDLEYLLEQSLIVWFGIVLPASIVVLCIIGLNLYDKSEIISLIFGIIITIIGSLLIIMSIYGLIDNIIGLGIYSSLAGYYTGSIVIMIAALGLAIVILLYGIKILRT
ncbi:MAG: hypothetical protein ACTSYB_13645 [Candidatus Helarchaeota archaeon]